MAHCGKDWGRKAVVACRVHVEARAFLKIRPNRKPMSHGDSGPADLSRQEDHLSEVDVRLKSRSRRSVEDAVRWRFEDSNRCAHGFRASGWRATDVAHGFRASGWRATDVTHGFRASGWRATDVTHGSEC